MVTLKKSWLFVLSAFAFLFGAFLWQRNKRQDAEAGLQNAEYNKDQAVLDEKLKRLDADKKDVLEQMEADKGRKLTVEEMEEFLRNL